MISNYSGFHAHCLVGSAYIQLSGICICNTVHRFSKRISIFGCRNNPSCHALFPSRRRVLTVPRPSGTILNIAPNMMNYIRADRAVGIVLNDPCILDKGL